MNSFQQTSSHHLVTLFEKEIKKAEFLKKQQEILKKLPSNFDPFSPPMTYAQGEDYLELIDIVEAVNSAKNHFVMFELGAGFGRWCINAMHALKFLNPIPFTFVAVECETAHFKFLEKYFIAHGLDLNEHELIKAAIDISEGKCLFNMGDPNLWYGQYIELKEINFKHKILYTLMKIYNNLKFDSKMKRRKEIVKKITLNSILTNYEYVDLIDMDIQSSELDVVRASVDLLNQKVKRIHIGTHSKEIDEGLNQVFRQHEWKNVHNYPSFNTCETPYGIIVFNDGVQSWINPRLE